MKIVDAASWRRATGILAGPRTNESNRLARLRITLPSLLVVAAGVFAPLPATAQAQDQQPLLLYEASYKIGYADFSEWLSLHRQHAAPILDELQQEGIIEGWNAYQHSTGGEYNFKMMIRAETWAAFDRFWSEYLGRLDQRAPDAAARIGALIQAHKDEVWDVAEAHFSEQAPPPMAPTYQYESLFQIGFHELAEWNRMHEQYTAPVLNQAMADGLLGGWVRLSHNTGGRYNWKIFYFFRSWDTIDDLFDRLLPALMADQAVWSRTGGMVRAHDDIIWLSIPQQ